MPHNHGRGLAPNAAEGRDLGREQPVAAASASIRPEDRRDEDTMTAMRNKAGTPNPTDKHVGSRVRLRRVMLNLTQTELARRLGFSYQQLQKYEAGINRLAASRLQQVSHILQVPVAFFFEGAPGLSRSRTRRKEGALPDYVIEFLSKSDGVALAKAFTRMRNMKLRRQIVRLAVEIMGRM